MGKTSYKRMKDLSKKLHKKIEKLENGKLHLDDIEGLVEEARGLYERLIVIRHKAYEKYGEPEIQEEEPDDIPEIKEDEKEIEAIEENAEVADDVNIKTEETKTEAEPAFDFSAGISDETEQPAFDFSVGEEASVESTVSKDESVLQKSDDVSVKTHEEESETFPKADDVKTTSADIFKESHIEKHEPEDPNTLNEKLKANEEESLRKKLQKSPITDLKAEISIAKKFEYITFMFDGKNEIYEEAINALNSCSDGDEAKDKLNEYSTKYNWDLENKSIMKFVELVERRYL